MAKAKSPRFVRTIPQLAAELGISSRMTSTYLAQGLREACFAGGQYDVAKAKAWKDEQVRKREAVDPDHIKTKKLAAQTRVAEADAVAKELKNDLLRGDLCYKRDAVQSWSAEFLRVKTRLEQIPEEFKLLFPGEQRQYLTGRLREKIDLILRELASTHDLEEHDGRADTDPAP